MTINFGFFKDQNFVSKYQGKILIGANIVAFD